MDALSAGRYLQSPEQEVKAQCYRRVSFVLTGIKGTLGSRVMGNEYKITAGFLLYEPGQQFFFLRFKIILFTGRTAISFGNPLFGLMKTNGRDFPCFQQLLRQPYLQQGKLRRVFSRRNCSALPSMAASIRQISVNC